MLVDWLLWRRATHHVLRADGGRRPGLPEPLQHLCAGEPLCNRRLWDVACQHADDLRAADRGHDARNPGDNIPSHVPRRTVLRDAESVCRNPDNSNRWFRPARDANMEHGSLYELSPRCGDAGYHRGSCNVRNSCYGAVCPATGHANHVLCTDRNDANDDGAHHDLHAIDHRHASSRDNLGARLQLPKQHEHQHDEPILYAQFE